MPAGRNPSRAGRNPAGGSRGRCISTMQAILPYAMGFAAGAMLYVISDEIIPETHRELGMKGPPPWD